MRQTWNGTIRLDAAQDSAPPVPPPNGAPPGSYRTFTATSGSVDVTIEGRFPGNCALDGTGHIDLIPGFINQLIVQLDVPNPAYVLAFTGLPTDVVQVTRSGGPGAAGRARSRSSRRGRAPGCSPTPRRRSRSRTSRPC